MCIFVILSFARPCQGDLGHICHDDQTSKNLHERDKKGSHTRKCKDGEEEEKWKEWAAMDTGIADRFCKEFQSIFVVDVKLRGPGDDITSPWLFHGQSWYVQLFSMVGSADFALHLANNQLC